MDEDNRFRRALKSPIVMIGLCIFAGITVYHNVMESTIHSSLPGSVASVPSPSAQAPITMTSSQMGHDAVATQWIDHPARDPFAPMSGETWSQSRSNQSTTSTFSNVRSQGSSPNTLRLKAVAIEAQQRSAVINRRVVYEGEMIEGYHIVSIQLKGVWLTRHGKKKFLTFATDTTS